MNPIELTGLRPDLPIAAMAAFGCLRVCQRAAGLEVARLSWSEGGHAVLWTPSATSREALIALLVADVRKACGRRELTLSDGQIKTATREAFRVSANNALDRANSKNRDGADWFAAFGSELVLDRNEKIDSTPFDMSVARQKFLADAQRLAASLAEEPSGRGSKSTADAYAEALFGPWRYGDDQHSLGWDPSTMKLGAFTYKAPTSMTNSGVRAAVWLAFESLPLFPCFCSRGALQVTAFQKRGREYVLYWPVWREPISLDTLRSLLGWVARAIEISKGELTARGVTAVYRSAKFKPNKYLSSFRAPELVFSAIG
jgi:hypothetical protein